MRDRNPVGLLDEAEFAGLVQELVDATAPRLFALVAEEGEREDACVAAWGLEFDDRTVLIGAGERPAFMLVDSIERAHRRLAQLGAVRLVHPHPGAPFQESRGLEAL